jgi:putative phage-type endonuclease
MRKDLIQVSTLQMTDDQWHDFRMNGIGASEVATIMGLNPYKSSIELFYEKIGQKEIYRGENAAMFWGTELEAIIAEKWQYWDPASPGQETMIANFRANNIVRRCERVNRYITNPAFTHLFVSLDRRIYKHGEKGEGALEVKTISGFSANQWESGIPPMYIVQLQQQLLVCDFDYGELAILKDGREMEVLPFEKNETIQQSILERTRVFWDMVIEARGLIILMNDERKQGNEAVAEALQGQIDALAPLPDGSTSYENYLKERYKDGGKGLMKGELIHLEIAKQYQSTHEHIAKLETAKNEAANKLKAVLGEYDVLDFQSSGKVTWKANAKGTRVFKVSINQ